MRLFGAWLPWKPCSWYSTRTKLVELNRSATDWRCLSVKNHYGRTYFDEFIPTAAFGVHVFLRHSVYEFIEEIRSMQMVIRLSDSRKFI